MEDPYVDGHQGLGSGWEELGRASHAQQKASTAEEAPMSYTDDQLSLWMSANLHHQPPWQWRDGHKYGMTTVPEMDSQHAARHVDSSYHCL